MDAMETGEYGYYWETQRFFDVEELHSWALDDAFSGYSDTSSPDGASSPVTAKKSIAQERERRKRFNDKLYTLRSLVPSISKMDKVSIVKDAIDYILELQEEERKLVAEVSELEQGNGEKKTSLEHDLSTQMGRKKRRTCAGAGSPIASPINVTELKLHEVGDGTCIVSLSCRRKKDTMARLCEALEPLNLNLMAANITSFSGNLLHTLCLETNEVDGALLKRKIGAALAC